MAFVGSFVGLAKFGTFLALHPTWHLDGQWPVSTHTQGEHAYFQIPFWADSNQCKDEVKVESMNMATSGGARKTWGYISKKRLSQNRSREQSQWEDQFQFEDYRYEAWINAYQAPPDSWLLYCIVLSLTKTAGGHRAITRAFFTVTSAKLQHCRCTAVNQQFTV